MSVALTRSPTTDLDTAGQAARHGGRRLRCDPRDDLALDRRRAGHGGLGLAAHRPRRRQPDRTHQARRRRARYRNAGARRHFGAAATAGEKARPRHHHGVDADPPQCGDQLQGAFARRGRLHSKAGEHARGHRRRDLPPRSDPEDPSSRRQGPPRVRRLPRARRWHQPPSGPATHRSIRQRHRLRTCRWRAGRSACWRRGCS